MDRLAQKHKDKVIDVLAERLCFERESVKLYDKVLDRMRQSKGAKRSRSGDGDYTTYGLSGYRDTVGGAREDIRRELAHETRDHERQEQEREEAVVAAMLPQMKEYRDQEKEHEEWLEGCIRRLGGDVKQVTEMARVGEREATGIEKIVMKDPEIRHLLHALLAAEHVDNAGWDLLVAIADEAGDAEAKKEFEKRLQQEAQHLAFLREALRIFSAHAILETELESPARGPA